MQGAPLLLAHIGGAALQPGGRAAAELQLPLGVPARPTLPRRSPTRGRRLQYSEVAQVASWDDALALAKQQRAAIQRLFQEQMHGKPPDPGDPAASS